jgi:hypothetical protein
MQELHDKFFVRTSASADATGYPKLAAAKGALESLANGHAKDPQRARGLQMDGGGSRLRSRTI